MSSDKEKLQAMLDKLKREKEQKEQKRKEEEAKQAKPAEPKAAPKKTKVKCQYCGKSYSEENIEEHEESCAKNPKNMKEEEDITSRIQALEDQVNNKIQSLETELQAQKQSMITPENLLETIKNLFQPTESMETSKLITVITPEIEKLLGEYAQKESKALAKVTSISWDEFYTIFVEYIKSHLDDQEFIAQWTRFRMGERLTRIINEEMYKLLPNEVQTLPGVLYPTKKSPDRAMAESWLKIYQMVIPSQLQSEKTELVIDYEREKFIMIARIIYQALMDSLNESLTKPGKTE